MGERLASSPEQARLEALRARAAGKTGSMRSSDRTRASGSDGRWDGPLSSFRSRVAPAVVSSRSRLAGTRGSARPPGVEEREERRRRATSRLRTRAERERSIRRAVSSSQLQASRSGESNIPGASAREEIALTPPPLRAPPKSRAA